MAIGKQLSDGNPDGTSMGQDLNDGISFYGATPVVRYATSVPPAASTAAVSVSATQWGFSTSTQASAIATMAYHMPILLAALGLSISA